MSERVARWRARWFLPCSLVAALPACNALLGIDDADVASAGAAGAAGASGGQGAGGGVGGAGAGGSGGMGGVGSAGSAGVSGSGGTGGGGGTGALQVTHVAAGQGHTCALVDGGEVRCWGKNDRGQLGDGTTIDRATPVPAQIAPGSPLAGVQALALGEGHSCALLESGEVRCWGANDRGQLGDGTTTDRGRPVQVELSPGASLTGVEALSLGGNHGCALVDSDRLACWGDNTLGALGDGTNDIRLNPVPVGLSTEPLAGVVAPVLGSQHSCALLEDGEVRCWGRGEFGELGDGTFENRTLPVPFKIELEETLLGVLSLAAGEFRTCVLTASGEAYCRGVNLAGQLGNGTTIDQEGAVRVEVSPGSPLQGIEALLAGGEHTCARVALGQVQCWGENSSGQMGDGSTTLRPSPVAVELSLGVRLTGAVALALGGSHSCALRDEGLLCWGLNGSGQLGDGTTTSRNNPTPVRFGP